MIDDEKIEEALQFVSSYAASATDWRVVKKELLRALPAEKRKLFSTRDPRTKAANFNEFEQRVALRWKEITGAEIYLPRANEDEKN
jgi:hypothetical protein